MVEVELEGVVKRQADEIDLRSQQPRRCEVGGVVVVLHHDVAAGAQQRRVDKEQRSGRSGREDHVLGRQVFRAKTVSGVCD